MKITVLQPNFFPFEGYFNLIKKVDKVVFIDNTFYNKKSWVDKTIIKKNNQKFIFRIPTIHSFKEETPLNDVTILSNGWKKNFLKFIENEYKNSVNFNKVYPIIEETINLPTDSVSMIASYSVFQISQLLKLNAKFSLASVDYSNLNGSLKYKIIEICKKEKSNNFYTFGIYKETFNSSFFTQHDIGISYLSSFAEEKYSIIDRLMNDDLFLK